MLRMLVWCWICRECRDGQAVHIALKHEWIEKANVHSDLGIPKEKDGTTISPLPSHFLPCIVTPTLIDFFVT
jgi:hypothetical protein